MSFVGGLKELTHNLSLIGLNEINLLVGVGRWPVNVPSGDDDVGCLWSVLNNNASAQKLLYKLLDILFLAPEQIFF